MGHFCMSIGNDCRFIAHDSFADILQQTTQQKINYQQERSVITLVASSDKHNASVWRLSVCLFSNRNRTRGE